MVINFIGSPLSSKTSTASLLFAQLKERGIQCEMVMEEARYYIAKEKWRLQTQHITLSNSDQLTILTKQLTKLEILSYSSPNSIIILDSSPLNALFYMGPSYSDSIDHSIFDKVTSLVDLAFYCAPVLDFSIKDPNRLHTVEQSSQIDQTIIPILTKYSPNILSKLSPLNGSIKIRAQIAMGKIMEEYYKLA